MAKTKVQVNAEQFTRKLTQRQIEYHVDVLRQLAESVDVMRQRAVDDFMIPRRGPYPRTEALMKKLYRMQPSHPTRMTHRLGVLKGVMRRKSSDKWKIPRKLKGISRLRAAKEFKAIISPELRGNSLVYNVDIRIGGGDVEMRVRNAMRGDSRGRVRKFMEPAIFAEDAGTRRRLGRAISKVRIV